MVVLAAAEHSFVVVLLRPHQAGGCTSIHGWCGKESLLKNFMFHLFSESPKMEFYGPEDIKKGQKAMQLDFKNASVDPRDMRWSTTDQVWKDGQRKTYGNIIEEILRDIHNESEPSGIYSRLKNLSLRMGRDIVCVGKKVSGVPGAQASGHLYPSHRAGTATTFIVAVGGGTVFAAAKGDGMKATGLAARLRWLDALYCWAIENGVRRVAKEEGDQWTVEEDIKKVKERMFFDDGTMDSVIAKGAADVLKDWWDLEKPVDPKTMNMEKLLEKMRNRQGLADYEEVDGSLLPEEAKASLEDLLVAGREKEAFRQADWLVMRRLYKGRKNRNHNSEHKRTEACTAKMIAFLKDTCTLKSGLCADAIWKGGENEWKKDGKDILARVNKAVARLEVLGFDGEGENNEYFQLAWAGDNGLEAVVLGPKFFPGELIEVMERDNIYILGVAVWEDLFGLTGRRTGWRGVDLSVMSSDLPSANHGKPGMAALILAATGVSVEHLKSGRMKKRLRIDGWNKAELELDKIIYAAMDATMVFPILFVVVIHWMHRYNKGDFYEGMEASWSTLLKRILGPLVDRARRGGSEADGGVKRDMLLQTAAKKKSVAMQGEGTSRERSVGGSKSHTLDWRAFS